MSIEISSWCAFTYGDGGKGEKEQGGVYGGTHVCNSHHHAPLTRPSAPQRASRDTETTLALCSDRLQSTGDVHTWVPSPGVAPVRVESPLNPPQKG